jgi:hypothetical protein
MTISASQILATLNNDASNVSSAQFFPRNDGPSDMRISSVPVGSRHTNQVPNKASGSSQEDIMAERKRREKLGQRFIALSAIVPGLKKVICHLI